MKVIFKYLNERTKLKLIKHNKNIQNKLTINLIHYIFFSGRYIIYEKNSKVKEYEYNNNELIYEGEYINCKRHGKGKEYHDKLLIYEGEYLNGKKHGKGKEYGLLTGKLVFEGEYLNGKKWNGIGYDEEKGNKIYEMKEKKGIRKEYNSFGSLIFEGEYLNGERNGKGKEYDFLGTLIFEGIYLNGKRWDGKGYDRKHNIMYELKDGKGIVK